MKKITQSSVNCVQQYPQCIVWNLCDIPCLGIKTGDTLDLITFAITNRLCELGKPFDMSTISIQCLIDKLGATAPLDISLASYLQLVIDNECTLKDLIDAINTRIDGLASTLVLDLKCLTLGAAYTEQQVLQALIDSVCELKDEVINIYNQINNLQTQINNLPPAYTEPTISSSCGLYTNKPTTQALTLLASDYCTYKEKVGTIVDISTAIGRQCSTLATEFVANPNFVQLPTSFAHTMNNMWVAFCSMRDRVIALEACACKFSCKDLLVGFITEFQDNKTVILKFTAGAGTFVPSDFKDCGSMLTISNGKGITTSPMPIVIGQDFETDEIDISMFSTGDYLTFDIEYKLCSDGGTCAKCIAKTVRYASGCCPVTNSGAEPITIVYKTCWDTPPVG